jgi:hypothetical protein
MEGIYLLHRIVGCPSRMKPILANALIKRIGIGNTKDRYQRGTKRELSLPPTLRRV